MVSAVISLDMESEYLTTVEALENQIMLMFEGSATARAWFEAWPTEEPQTYRRACVAAFEGRE